MPLKNTLIRSCWDYHNLLGFFDLAQLLSKESVMFCKTDSYYHISISFGFSQSSSGEINNMKIFMNRSEAGKILAAKLSTYAKRSDVMILALPRGGVPVAYEIAKALSVPLDVLIVRKLGVPGFEELAMGAIVMGGTMVFNDEIVHQLNIPKEAIDRVIQSEQEELKRREINYRGDRPLPKLTDKTVILVDDGIATGATMRAAIQALRQYKPLNIIIAVPVAGLETCEEMEPLVDKMVCALKPQYFHAVGEWYQDFSQTSDTEVHELLKKNK